MPVRIYRCAYCEVESQNEQEIIDHERSHSKTMLCTKVQKKTEVPCTLNILEKPGEEEACLEFTFTWTAEKEAARTMSSVYLADKNNFVDLIENFLPQ